VFRLVAIVQGSNIQAAAPKRPASKDSDLIGRSVSHRV
jgi:hypothetical protein